MGVISSGKTFRGSKDASCNVLVDFLEKTKLDCKKFWGRKNNFFMRQSWNTVGRPEQTRKRGERLTRTGDGSLESGVQWWTQTPGGLTGERERRRRQERSDRAEGCSFILRAQQLASYMLRVKVISPGLSWDKWTGPDGEREPRANRFWLIKIMFEIYIDMMPSLSFICQVDRPTILLGIKLWQENLTVPTAAA